MEPLKRYSKEEFKKLRKKYNISHKEIGDIIHKPPQYVCDYENGRRGSIAVDFLLTYILDTIIKEKSRR